MARRRSFTATIQEGSGGGAWVEMPFDVAEVFGTRARVKVQATFDGETYRGSIVPMVGGGHVLGITVAIRQKIQKSIGDRVKVTVEPDAAPRTVEIPSDLATRLRRHPGAKKFFDGLAYTYRKEYAAWIAGAVREATRERRLEQAIEKLENGEKL